MATIRTTLLLGFAILSCALGCDSNSPINGPGTIILEWDKSTAKDDGSDYLDAQGYEIHYGTEPGQYTVQVSVDDVSTASIEGLESGTTYYFVAQAVDSSGNMSDFSNELAAVAP